MIMILMIKHVFYLSLIILFTSCNLTDQEENINKQKQTISSIMNLFNQKNIIDNDHFLPQFTKNKIIFNYVDFDKGIDLNAIIQKNALIKTNQSKKIKIEYIKHEDSTLEELNHKIKLGILTPFPEIQILNNQYGNHELLLKVMDKSISFKFDHEENGNFYFYDMEEHLNYNRYTLIIRNDGKNIRKKSNKKNVEMTWHVELEKYSPFIIPIYVEKSFYVSKFIDSMVGTMIENKKFFDIQNERASIVQWINHSLHDSAEKSTKKRKKNISSSISVSGNNCISFFYRLGGNPENPKGDRTAKNYDNIIILKDYDGKEIIFTFFENQINRNTIVFKGEKILSDNTLESYLLLINKKGLSIAHAMHKNNIIHWKIVTSSSYTIPIVIQKI
ncbi:MAG: hypothetical protein ACRCVW_03210 [Brevinema sp.]